MKSRRLKKHIVSYTAILAAMLLVLEAGIFWVGYRDQLDTAVSRNEEMAQTMGTGFDNSITAFQKQVTYISMSEDLQEGLQAYLDSGTNTPAEANALRSVIVRNVQTMNEITGIYLYDPEGVRITYWQKSPWNQTLASRYAAMPDADFAEDGTIRLDTWNGDVVFTRKILSYQTGSFMRPLGYIVFFYDLHEFEMLLGKIAPDENRMVTLVSPDGELIGTSPTASERLRSFAAEDPDAYARIPGTHMDGPAGKRVLVCNYASQEEGWIVSHLMEESELTRPLRATGTTVLVISAVGVLLGLLLIVQNARHMTKPLSELKEQVEKIENGDYRIRNEVKTGDEIEELAGTVNEMAEQIDELINRQLRDELRYKDQRFLALQAQINPHFLYNTLECINSLAELGRKEDVRRVTVAFSELMKSLTQETRMVTIAEEFRYTEDFLTIYGIMLGDKLSWRIVGDPELTGVEVPRLTVQPLVENAVLHGVRPCDHACEIVVAASMAEEGLLISVTDDGVGMEPEEAERLMAGLEDADGGKDDGRSIGLPNVYRRLKLLYGDGVSLSMTGYPDLGTTVDILIPHAVLPEYLREE